MADLEGLADKFTVVKNEDIIKYLSEEQTNILASILTTVAKGREKDGSKENSYVVINTDEPYASDVINLMKQHGHWG